MKPPHPAVVADADLADLLSRGVEAEASDLHLVVGYPPTFRIHGRLEDTGGELLTAEVTARMVTTVLPTELRESLAQRHDLDFSLSLDYGTGARRFRVNVFYQQGSLGACFRFVPETIPTFQWMGFPSPLADRIAALPGGLVMVTGVTGSGKTTTLAALVQRINQEGHRRIITIEEPIEYVFPPSPHSVVSQREVGVDVPTFADGLKFGLRQDPDVILVGEVRDPDTARMVMSAAETGHLVLTTVHTRDARGAVTRLVDIFPADRQDDVRGQLSLSLQLVISQHLIPSAHVGEKRVLAMEILVASDPVRAAIRQNKIESIDTHIQTGKRFGMQTLDEDLIRLVIEQRIAGPDARRLAKNPNLIAG